MTRLFTNLDVSGGFEVLVREPREVLGVPPVGSEPDRRLHAVDPLHVGDHRPLPGADRSGYRSLIS